MECNVCGTLTPDSPQFCWMNRISKTTILKLGLIIVSSKRKSSVHLVLLLM